MFPRMGWRLWRCFWGSWRGLAYLGAVLRLGCACREVLLSIAFLWWICPTGAHSDRLSVLAKDRATWEKWLEAARKDLTSGGKGLLHSTCTMVAILKYLQINRHAALVSDNISGICVISKVLGTGLG